ncbi:hypothetical protein AADZ90_001965 [Aestuariibius sp. 2305UL40-4]|uniref:hypothetical protein n=1 Tax=Aestuariibius violaceus TaxID=3234132 RepID=UPI00345E2848
MPLVIATVSILAFAFWRLYLRDRARDEVAARADPVWRKLTTKRPCQWSETGSGRGAFREYHCATCRATAYSRTGKAPETCKRNVRGGL